jgi:cobalamin biosynthesis protein CobD/CbiB
MAVEERKCFKHNANVSTDNITLAEVETSEVVNTVTEVETVAEVETNKVVETVTESVSDETSDPVFWVSFDLDVHKTNGIANAEFAIIANNKYCKDRTSKTRGRWRAR